MMKKTLAAIGGLTLLAGAAFSMHAVAGGDRHHRGFNPERMVERFGKRLDLTDAQKTEVQAIVENAMPVMQAARDDMKAGRSTMIELDPTAADYDAQVEALADKAADHARAMVTQLGDVRQDVSAVLDETQRAKFDDMLTKSKRWGRGHKRGRKSGD